MTSAETIAAEGLGEFTFTRIVYPTRNRPGWTEPWRLVGSHTSTARVGCEPSRVPDCPGCRHFQEQADG